MRPWEQAMRVALEEGQREGDPRAGAVAFLLQGGTNYDDLLDDMHSGHTLVVVAHDAHEVRVVQAALRDAVVVSSQGSPMNVAGLTPSHVIGRRGDRSEVLHEARVRAYVRLQMADIELARRQREWRRPELQAAWEEERRHREAAAWSQDQGLERSLGAEQAESVRRWLAAQAPVPLARVPRGGP